MDRTIVYPGQAPRSLDLLLTNRNTMTAIGMLLAAILGTGTVVDGLAISPTTPASMQVQVGQGAIYSQQQIDPNAYSSLAADTTDLIIKQGLVFGTTLLTLTAPATSGQSQVYLVQAAFQETDGGSVLLPYYNASNPAVPWQGPANGGTSQYTLRQGQCVIGLKAGIAAATGSQTVPAPDAGYTGLYAITVANGATTVTSGNIATLATAPFVGLKLPAIPAAVQSGRLVYGAATGTNTYAVTLAPAPAALTIGMEINVLFANANTSTTCTLNVNGLGAVPITRSGGSSVALGDIAGGGLATLSYDGTQWQFQGAVRFGAKTQNYTTAGTYTFTPPTGVYAIFGRIWGGAGGGGGANYNNVGGGGAGGGYTEGWFPATPGVPITIVVGVGGTGGINTGGTGGSGGTSSLGALASATGGQGGGGNLLSGGGSAAIGGAATGGTLPIAGANGGIPGPVSYTAQLAGGFGGGSFGSSGGTASGGQVGQQGAGPGAGGGGGAANGGSTQNPGANGQPGAVLLSW